MKKILKKFSPNPEDLKNHKYLGWLSKHLYNPSLWNLNRKSISKAFAVGLFCAFIPTPFQMLIAAPSAVIFSANLPLSVALVWISNPITIPFIFYLAYRLGAYILGTSIQKNFMQSVDYIQQASGDTFEILNRTIEVFASIWQPFLLGSMLFSIVSSILGYWLVQFIYRYRAYKRRFKTQLVCTLIFFSSSSTSASLLTFIWALPLI